jgi:hypothetical protein
MRRVVFVCALLMFAAAQIASAHVRGGAGGVVGPGKVGPLRLNHSSRNPVLAYAGTPSSVSYLNGIGERPSHLSQVVWEGLSYGSTTTYWLWRAHPGSPWLFNGFFTKSRRWHTPAGTRVGMSASQAKRRERVRFVGGCYASGYWHSSPAPPSGNSWSYLVSILNGRVNELGAVGAHGPIC